MRTRLVTGSGGRQEACGGDSGREQGSEDGARRSADQTIGFARIEASLTVKSGDRARHPRTAQDASGAQDNAHSPPAARRPITLTQRRHGVGHLPVRRQATFGKRAGEWAIRSECATGGSEARSGDPG
jgi:hypothetical protein